MTAMGTETETETSVEAIQQTIQWLQEDAEFFEKE